MITEILKDNPNLKTLMAESYSDENVKRSQAAAIWRATFGVPIYATSISVDDYIQPVAEISYAIAETKDKLESAKTDADKYKLGLEYRLLKERLGEIDKMIHDARQGY